MYKLSVRKKKIKQNVIMLFNDALDTTFMCQPYRYKEPQGIDLRPTTHSALSLNLNKTVIVVKNLISAQGRIEGMF